MSRQSNNLKSWDVQLHRNTFSICLWFKIFKVLYLPEIISKNQTNVKKVGPNRISFWHLLVNLKNKYLFKKVLKWANKEQNNFNIYNAALKKNRKSTDDTIIWQLCTKNLDDMIYSSWDIEFDRLKLVILGQFIFGPFTL